MRILTRAFLPSFLPALTHAFNCVQLGDNGILTKPIYGTYIRRYLSLSVCRILSSYDAPAAVTVKLAEPLVGMSAA